MMKVTAPLGLSKIPWCPWHGIQLHEDITWLCVSYWSFSHSTAISTSLPESSWWGTRRKRGREASEQQQGSEAGALPKPTFYFHSPLGSELISNQKNHFSRWQTKLQSAWKAASRGEIPERGSKNARWSLTKCCYCVLSPGKLFYSSKL